MHRLIILCNLISYFCRPLAVVMASTVKAKTWLRGIVKAVLSGDTLVIMRVPSSTLEIPPEKTITLSSLMAPRLVKTTSYPCSLYIQLVSILIITFDPFFFFFFWEI